MKQPVMPVLPCGTQELVDMFPMIDGLPITESKLYDPKHPYEQRDPRLYETVVVNGDNIMVVLLKYM